MKKLLLMVMLIFTICLTSCNYKGYSGNHSNLFSAATNSVLFLNGYSWKADYKCDPRIEIIEEDNYGRTLFSYYEKYYKGANISFSALIICQSSNEKEVLFYEDINYLIKEQRLYSKNTETFTDDEIENLKLVNDWNKEINYDKCVRKEITKIKEKIPHEKEIKKQIIDKFDLNNEKYLLFMDYLTSNVDESKYIIYGYISQTDKDGIYFVGIVELDVSIKLNTIILSNVYEYKKELVEFKQMNNWY